MLFFLNQIPWKAIILVAGLFLLSACEQKEVMLGDITIKSEELAKLPLEFSRKIGGTEYEHSIQALMDHEIIISGDTNGSFGSSTDILISKLNKSGVILSTKVIGGSNRDYLTGLIRTKENGVLVIASTYSLFFSGISD